MKLVLCARLLNWSIDRVRRKPFRERELHLKQQGQRDRGTKGQSGERAPFAPLSLCPSVPSSLRPLVPLPLVIIRSIADRQLVVAVSEEAAGFGIRRGMTLTQARALHADVEHAEYEPEKDRRALEALGRWMMRFSPVVALDVGKTSDVAPEALFLDLTGCDRLFGGLENILQRVSNALVHFGISAHVAIAPTPGAAWALADSGKDLTIVPSERLELALDPLPVCALRIAREISTALNHLGLCTIGQVTHLPREVLPARFGQVLLRRIDEALGRIPEPLIPLEYRPPIEARMEWDGAMNSLEAIWSAFQKLISQIIPQLVGRGSGARRVDVDLLRAHAPSVRKMILLSRPSRDPVNLFNLFRCALEGLELPSHDCVSRICDEGFSGLRVTVPLFEPVGDEQISLLDHERYAGQAELDRLIERLRVRLGNDSVIRLKLVESYVPERTWENSNDEIRMTNQIRNPNNRMTKRNSDRPFHHSSFEFRHSPSPLHLFPVPIEVRVMVTPSEDAEGKPAAFTHDGAAHQIAHAVGPERIAGRWWDGHDKTRDYFDVADITGRRFWLFRVTQTGRWYLHGTFE